MQTRTDCLLRRARPADAEAMASIYNEGSVVGWAAVKPYRDFPPYRPDRRWPDVLLVERLLGGAAVGPEPAARNRRAT